MDDEAMNPARCDAAFLLASAIDLADEMADEIDFAYPPLHEIRRKTEHYRDVKRALVTLGLLAEDEAGAPRTES